MSALAPGDTSVRLYFDENIDEESQQKYAI
jgi:hypothetical protein